VVVNAVKAGPASPSLPNKHRGGRLAGARRATRKVSVIKACLYDTQIDRIHADMSTHYDAGVLPAPSVASEGRGRAHCRVASGAIAS
jgi:hypothetical protein